MMIMMMMIVTLEKAETGLQRRSQDLILLQNFPAGDGEDDYGDDDHGDDDVDNDHGDDDVDQGDDDDHSELKTWQAKHWRRKSGKKHNDIWMMVKMWQS